MGDHHNCKHSDDVWLLLFRRWHAGETAPALRAEAGVSPDTWHANAKALGMRIKDLPAEHPARRRVPAFADRPDDYRHPKSRLTEGEWKALFAERAQGVADRALVLKYDVPAATLSTQAEARGISRKAARAAVAAMLEGDGAGKGGDSPDRAAATRPSSPSAQPPSPRGGERRGLGGVNIVPGDAATTGKSFEAVIVEAGRTGDYVEVARRANAKLSVERAMFGRGAGGRPHPAGEDADDPAPAGEGEAPVKLRKAQRPPKGDWSTWLFLGGRGAGKTLAGAMWLADMAEALGPRGRLALIGPTLHDVREVMIDGVSGIVGLARWRRGPWAGKRPVFEPSRRRLTFPNGAVAYAFSAEDPDSLRGPQFGAAWADEFCAWPRTRGGPGETLALLRMGLRLGARPRLCVTTTPKPIAGLRTLRAEAGVAESHAATRDNAAHLSAGFVEGLERLYGGTRKAEQELEGRVVEVDGALFTAEMMARARGVASPSPEVGRVVAKRPGGEGQAYPTLSSLRANIPPHKGEGDRALPVFDRIVVAIDPTTTASGNACGIVVAGRCGERAHVLADRSASGLGPDGWARRAVRAAEEFGAHALVAEVNQGGEMVKAVLKTAGCTRTVREVRASKGKRVRAEPVAALYEQGRVTHAAGLGLLEEELMAFGGEDEAAYDLDRADALVWAVTDLLIDREKTRLGPNIRTLDVPMRSSGITGRAW